MPVQPNVTYSHEDLCDPEFAIVVLHNSIVQHDNNNFQLAISYLKKANFDMNARLDESTAPVLVTAIRFENQFAVEQLLKSGLVDIRAEYLGLNSINRAAHNGNLPILNVLYSRDSNINDICFNTPLMNTITQVISYSLIHDSNWENEENKRKMIGWYEGNITLSGELGISAEYNPKQTSTLEINWKGGFAMAKYLLERGANPKIANDAGLDAEFIINNLSSPKCLALFRDCDQTLKFLSEKKGILSFYATLEDRKKTKKIRVKVNYDPKEIRELINSYAKKITDKQTSTKSNFKEHAKIEEELLRVKQEVKAANSKVDKHAEATCKQLQSLHAKVDTQTAVVNNNAAVLANQASVTSTLVYNVGKLNSEMAKVQEDIKTIFEDFSPLKKLAENEKELAIIRANNVQHTFYENVFKQIDDFILSNKLLKAGMIKRDDYTIADKVAIGVDLVGGKIPIIGIAASAISKGITKATDYYEGKKWERVYRLVPADHIAFSKELAITITKHYRAQLEQISNAKYNKAEEPIQKAMKLASIAVEVMTESMSNTKVDKAAAPITTTAVINTQAKIVESSKFAAKIEKYSVAAAKNQAPVKADITSPKTPDSKPRVASPKPIPAIIFNKPVGTAPSAFSAQLAASVASQAAAKKATINF